MRTHVETYTWQSEDYGLVAMSPQLTLRMRSILVAWMLEVSLDMGMHFETFMAGVDYLDRYLSVTSVERAKLQLVGVVALWIGAKVVEVSVPEVGELAYMCDGACTIADMLQMERSIVDTLKFLLCPRRSKKVPRVHNLAAALYVTRRSSLRLHAAVVRRTIRNIRWGLTHGRLKQTLRRARHPQNIDPFVEQLHDKLLAFRNDIGVKFGVTVTVKGATR